MSPAGARRTDRRRGSPPSQPGSAESTSVEPVEAAPVEPAPVQAEAAEPGAVEEPVAPGGAERLIRVAGIVVSLLAAFVSAVFELLLTTLRAGDVVSVWRGDPIGSGGGPLLGVSVLLAIVGNLVIAWFAVATTGRRWAFGPAWALWTVLMFVAAGVRTAEGDYLLSGTNYIALATILIGSLTFAIYAYRIILKRMPPAAPRADGPAGN